MKKMGTGSNAKTYEKAVPKTPAAKAAKAKKGSVANSPAKKFC